MMKELIMHEIRESDESLQVHLLREKLQHLILKVIDEKKFFSQIHFLGGTALRVLYKLKRFSEDLDFSLDPQQKKKFNFDLFIQSIQNDLADYGFQTELKKKTTGAVRNCYFKFSHILPELSSRFKINEKLSIRVDIDTNPPLGFGIETTAVKNDFLIKIKHYDKPSLFAGKLHAIIGRNYLKGRDIYDFIWYCASETPVNLTLLNNAYKQTHLEPPPWNKNTLSEFIAKKIHKMDLKKAYQDASFFMEDLAEKRFFDSKLLVSMARKIKIE